MIITKMALPRRTFLRGMGATLALPLLDAMVPALSAQARTAAKPVRRLGFIYMPNGVSMNFSGVNYWKPKGVGTNFELSPILAPLAAVQESDGGVQRPDAHAGRCVGGRRQRRSRARHQHLAHRRPSEAHGRRRRLQRDLGRSDRGAGARQGHAAAVARAEPRPQLPGRQLRERLQLRLHEHAGVAFGRPRALPTENNPRAVFERLFGDGGSSAQRLAQAQREPQHPRFGHRRGGPAAERRSAPAIGPR